MFLIIMLLKKKKKNKFQMTAQFSRLMTLVVGSCLETRSKTETS